LPLSFVNYAQDNLYPWIQPPNAFSVHAIYSQIAMEQQIATHLQAYEDASVKYLLTRTRTRLAPQLAAVGVKKVWSDLTVTIYSLPDPRPFFSTDSSSCTVSSASFTEAKVNCPTSGSTLVRSEQSMKGWTVTVNGHPAPITTVDTVYQQIEVPQGTSTVEFTFLPPHERLAVILGLAALLALSAAALDERIDVLSFFRRGRRERPRFSRPDIDEDVSSSDSGLFGDDSR
jgi:hypothetical protein